MRKIGGAYRRVERNHHRACFPDCEAGDHECRRIRQGKDYAVTGINIASDQALGKAIRLKLDTGVGKTLCATDELNLFAALFGCDAKRVLKELWASVAEKRFAWLSIRKFLNDILLAIHVASLPKETTLSDRRYGNTQI
jgi:hypothetical protein